MADLTRPQIALQFFQRTLGLTPAQAAGLVGNLQQESGPNLNPTLLGDNGASFGVFQHQGPRRRALNAFAAERGKDPSDFQTQLEFAAHEFRTTERRAFDRLRSARTPEEAARAAVSFFRPSDPRTENRIRNAIRLAGGGTAPTVRTVQTIPVGTPPQTATAAPAAVPAAAPTISPTPPAGLLAPSGGSTMANGTQPGQGGGFDVRGLLADPLLNLGVGLLAASGPSTTPVSLGQALAQGVQFASRREQESAKNEIARQQVLAAQRQAQARARLSQNPGLLGLTPEQGERFGLLAEAFPQQAGGLLAQMFGQQRAEPADIRTMRTLGIPLTPEGFRTFQSIKSGMTPLQLSQLQRNQAELDKLFAERETERKTQTQKVAESRDAFITGLNTVQEMAGQLDFLEGKFLEPGRVLPEARRFILSLGNEIFDRIPGFDDKGEREKIIATRDKFVKNASDFVIKMFSRMPGQMTDSRQRILEQSLAGISTSPGAARSIMARTVEMFLMEAEREGTPIPASEIERAQKLIARLRGGGEAAPSDASPAAAPSAAPSQPAQPGQTQSQPGVRALLRRASERLGRTMTEKDIQDSMRERGLTRKQVIEELRRRFGGG